MQTYIFIDFFSTRPTPISRVQDNKAGYTATLVACGWAGAVLEKVTKASGQEPYAQKAQKRQKSNSRKSVRWSAVPMPRLSRMCLKLKGEQGSGPKGVDDLCFYTWGIFSFSSSSFRYGL